MANTYSQMYIHVVFSVKGRSNLISKTWRTNLYKYITGITKQKSEKLMYVGGVADHIHILLSLNPDSRLSDIVRDIKANSSRWINEQQLVKGQFAWQRGFGAFAVCTEKLKSVIAYIQNQEEHHRVKRFRDEYIELLESNGIGYKPEFLFDDYGDNSELPDNDNPNP